MNEKGRKRSLIWKMSKDELENIISVSSSLSEVIERIGFSKTTGGAYKTLKERIEKENINMAGLEERRRIIFSNASINKKQKLENILVKDSTFSRRSLKKRLIEEKIIEEKCFECGNPPEWNGKKLVLQLEHKNGINNDNRLENLCLMCPNCHSQTKTYAGRANKKREVIIECLQCKKEVSKKSKSGLCVGCCAKITNQRKRKIEKRPGKYNLMKMLGETSFVEVGKKYGVSDNAVRKWCKQYDLPTSSKEIKKMWREKNDIQKIEINS